MGKPVFLEPGAHEQSVRQHCDLKHEEHSQAVFGGGDVPEKSVVQGRALESKEQGARHRRGGCPDWRKLGFRHKDFQGGAFQSGDTATQALRASATRLRRKEVEEWRKEGTGGKVRVQSHRRLGPS